MRLKSDPTLPLPGFDNSAETIKRPAPLSRLLSDKIRAPIPLSEGVNGMELNESLCNCKTTAMLVQVPWWCFRDFLLHMLLAVPFSTSNTHWKTPHVRRLTNIISRAALAHP